MNKKLSISLILLGLIGLFIGLVQGGVIGSGFLWDISNEGSWYLPLVLVSALMDSINPCAFSVLLITIGFLLSAGSDSRKLHLIGGAYIFGIFVTYALIGLGILQALHLFNTPHFMSKVGAGLLIILGSINLINQFFPNFPIKLKIPSIAHGAMARLMSKASVPTAFFLGGLVALCEFPCTGGPYLLVLGLLHDSATWLKGLGYLLLYNLVFVFPLVVILSLAGNEAVLEKIRSWKREKSATLHLWIGILMVILGVVIFYL